MDRHKTITWCGIAILDMVLLMVSLIAGSVWLGLCAFILAIFLSKKMGSGPLPAVGKDNIPFSEAKPRRMK